MPDQLHNANDIIETQLCDRVMVVEKLMDADVIAYVGPIADGVDTVLKKLIESISTKRRKLTVLLETNGGYIESAERVANILRHHYDIVEFVVLSFAMSAGTVLVMSGDSIYMDYSATLGPIDPQVQRSGSDRFVPALGYLEQYERLVEKSNGGTLSTAELAYLIQNFDPAELYQFEQARDLSIALLEEWLVKYKFKNWVTTETSCRPVTEDMRKARADQIARQLNDTARWHSHNRGISMEILRRELKLRIEDVEDTPDLHSAIKSYYNLLNDYRNRLGHYLFVTHWRGEYHGH